jgi:5-methylcytosine-specific restriction protein B
MVSAEPGEKDPDRPRVRVTTQYYDLPTTIALEQLASLRSLRGRHLPIDKDGFVKQAYLCILTPEGFAEILSLIPEASIPSPFQQYRQKSEPISSQRAMLTDKFVEKAAEDIRKSGFKVTDAMFRRFITALLAKPFVILTGTSGTGKTQLALKFAQWLVGREKYQLVAVGADWTDNRQVLGHYNPFEEKFISTKILDLVLDARDDQDSPYFLILDEMNLSHVERYFADFLSALEAGESIALHRNGSSVQTACGRPVKKSIRIPDNLFIVGTVNIDETTYMFSPKVLDRANVIEFGITATELKDFIQSGDRLRELTSRAGDGLPEAFLQTARDAGASDKEGQANGTGDLALPGKHTVALFSLLEGSGMEFGFRGASEVERCFEIWRRLTKPEDWNAAEVCDYLILQKILPKLHGSRMRIEPLLAALASYCSTGDLEAASKFRERKTPANAVELGVSAPLLKNSYQKLVRMLEVVRRDQFVSFIQ